MCDPIPTWSFASHVELRPLLPLPPRHFNRLQDLTGNGYSGLLRSDATSLPRLTGSTLAMDGAQKQFVAISNMNAAWGALSDWSMTMSISFVSACPQAWKVRARGVEGRPCLHGRGEAEGSQRVGGRRLAPGH